ncbi:MAG: 6-carboxytetrahydropterin synthase QueD [Deltaproteobacteria bacterium]|nr:6-carboxytetrahydropterin synthase QueD [Deltaproteobacteria bacterium]
MFKLTVTSSFSAAHNIRGYEGKCENLHGHNWKVEAGVSSKRTDRLGMVVDFKILKDETKKVLDSLDHKYLNETPPFDRLNPTAENIARFVYKTLSSRINGRGIKITGVKVWESENSAASYSE